MKKTFEEVVNNELEELNKNSTDKAVQQDSLQSKEDLFFDIIKNESETFILSEIEKNKEIIKYENSSGFTIVCWSLLQKKPKVAKELINAGSNVEKVSNVMKLSPLILAVDYPDILKELINKKVDINHQTSSGVTALSAASARQNIESVKILLDNKAEISKENSCWPTVLSACLNIEIFNFVI